MLTQKKTTGGHFEGHRIPTQNWLCSPITNFPYTVGMTNWVNQSYGLMDQQLPTSNMAHDRCNESTSQNLLWGILLIFTTWTHITTCRMTRWLNTISAAVKKNICTISVYIYFQGEKMSFSFA